MSANTTVGEMLAVNGGQPVRETLLPYGRQAIDDDDIQAVVETLRSDWLTTGPKVEEFEEAFAARAVSRHGQAQNMRSASAPELRPCTALPSPQDWDPGMKRSLRR